MSQLVAENPAYCQWMLRVSEAVCHVQLRSFSEVLCN